MLIKVDSSGKAKMPESSVNSDRSMPSAQVAPNDQANGNDFSSSNDKHLNKEHNHDQAVIKANNNAKILSNGNQETKSSRTNTNCTSRNVVDEVLASQLPSKTSSFTADESLRNSDEQGSGNFITIVHFNDCYNVEPGPESSGAAGFLTAVNQFRHLNPMILFSGDIISPSFMSTFTKGEQMIPVLNHIGVDCAVFGNHEFDFGVDNLIDFTKRTNFPWLLSNVVDKETSSQLGEGKIYHLIEREGIKFGLIGLIEEEWLSTLSTLDSSDVIYEDFVVRGQQLARELKREPHSVDYVIALTHFRTPNDCRLADSVPEIDLILGGHDHDYEVLRRSNCCIVKSGTDFREFSLIKLHMKAHNKRLNRSEIKEYGRSEKENEAATNTWMSDKGKQSIFCDPEIERINCFEYPPNQELQKKLEKFVSTIDEKMGKVLGQFNCDLDGRFSSIRKYETNLGNFVTDIMLASTHADLAILNSGTLRSDRIHPKGDFTMRDLFNILGYIDPISVLQANGHQIWQALENGVSQWPKLEGRFPQVSGCTFTFDPNKPAGERIDPRTITVGDEPMALDKSYRLTTKAYLASGKDGYDVLKECKTLVPGDESPDLTTSILNHFEAINIVKSNRRTHHRQSIICLSRSSLQKLLDSQQRQQQQQQQTEHSEQTTTATTKSDGNNNNNNNYHQHHHQNDCNQNSVSHDLDCSLFSETRIVESQHECDGESFSDFDAMATSVNGEQTQQHATILSKTSAPLGKSAPTPATVTTSQPPINGETPVILSRAQSYVSNQASTEFDTRPRTKRLMSLYEMEHEQCKLEPKAEGRIRILGVNV